jgi:hypothetical protein
MAEITMPLDEWESIKRLISSERESEGAREEAVEKKKATRKKTKNDRAMSRGLSEANAKAKLKNGSWRKGWNQSKLMTEAHRLRRKYTK